MPVNMTPKRKRTEPAVATTDSLEQTETPFGQETELDREKDVADAESKDMWDQTEVIDMDTF